MARSVLSEINFLRILEYSRRRSLRHTALSGLARDTQVPRYLLLEDILPNEQDNTAASDTSYPSEPSRRPMPPRHAVTLEEAFSALPLHECEKVPTATHETRGVYHM